MWDREQEHHGAGDAVTSMLQASCQSTVKHLCACAWSVYGATLIHTRSTMDTDIRHKEGSCAHICYIHQNQIMKRTLRDP